MRRWAVPSRSGALLAVIVTAVVMPGLVDVAVDVAKSGAVSVPDSMYRGREAGLSNCLVISSSRSDVAR